MKSILKVEVKTPISSLYTYELFDDHTLLATANPNPRFDSKLNPWPIAQEELSWKWDEVNKVIKVRRYSHQRSTKLFTEEEEITKAYLNLLSDLLVK